ncbi:hypothetical protein CVT24_010176 [Panaeolus cyanescens]|uniref:Uncharacterized protein n=1 Tax=Panaeolus cyanescens TaxID=181874 RepID=A0A409W9M1_9AGAR|nr:hypothetical protein CVT24_010176 [Panaeolus cyanescens]
MANRNLITKAITEAEGKANTVIAASTNKDDLNPIQPQSVRLIAFVSKAGVVPPNFKPLPAVPTPDLVIGIPESALLTGIAEGSAATVVLDHIAQNVGNAKIRKPAWFAWKKALKKAEPSAANRIPLTRGAMHNFIKQTLIVYVTLALGVYNAYALKIISSVQVSTNKAKIEDAIRKAEADANALIKSKKITALEPNTVEIEVIVNPQGTTPANHPKNDKLDFVVPIHASELKGVDVAADAGKILHHIRQQAAKHAAKSAGVPAKNSAAWKSFETAEKQAEDAGKPASGGSVSGGADGGTGNDGSKLKLITTGLVSSSSPGAGTPPPAAPVDAHPATTKVKREISSKSRVLRRALYEGTMLVERDRHHNRRRRHKNKRHVRDIGSKW